ncbi:dTDP-4-amino-4,6-dideoxygalactose transaminase [Hydrogenispora ethanolica]|uniref:dTDP-4-amino-4,6-dideoxygalactose transaminase n=1 Tax=Hydrogenispora ethanolica TaxID=1082276 RepID=A0A4R1R844_HYDET|nr:DegT/DnrJ/EryC1/StrS family aminotransferase [Hydrogenispora ethanolica]TCL61814.1 dTDP-4-amino-4,6-dideoxygalactose transaminase [Hydrogenispora ethanolica]
MQVPAFDLTRQNEQLAKPLAEAYQKVVAGGNFILGEAVKRFEAEMAEVLRVKHAVAVANGSDALVLALMALEIGPGDEVIVPGFTFFATAGAVCRVGATPVFADVLPGSYNLNPAAVRTKVTSRTKAIVPVHLFGGPAAMAELMALASEYNVAVIEDAAQSGGSICGGLPTGSIGDLGCFSFFPTKNLGCFGDGGMVTTQSDALAEKLRMLRVHGARKKYYHELLGFNSRLDTLQAAILQVKLPHLGEWLARRQAIAAKYREGLKGVPGIHLPDEAEGHTYNQFTITTPRRDALREYLAAHAIGSTIYYPLGLHLQPVFSGLGYGRGDLPVTEELTETVLSLPVFPELSEAEQEYVIAKILKFSEGETCRK